LDLDIFTKKKKKGKTERLSRQGKLQVDHKGSLFAIKAVSGIAFSFKEHLKAFLPSFPTLDRNSTLFFSLRPQ
jgi:hypothetical protein